MEEGFDFFIGERGAIDVAGPFGAVVDVGGGEAGEGDHFIGQVCQRNFGPCADVHDFFVSGRERCRIGSDDVVDRDEVSCLRAVAEDGDRFLFGERFGENVNHAAFAIGALPRSVHIAVAEHGVVEAVELVVEGQVFFRHPLGEAVEGFRCRLLCLFEWQLCIVSINGSGGGEDHFLHAGLPRIFENGKKAHDIFIGIIVGVFDGDRHHGLRGFVVNHIEVMGFENGRQLFIADVRFDKFSSLRNEFFRPGGQVVDDGDLMAFRQKGVCQMGSDESGAAGNQYTQENTSWNYILLNLKMRRGDDEMSSRTFS